MPASRISVIVPAYNEERIVGEVVSDIKRHGYSVLVVDDKSVDQTASVAHEAGALVVRHPINLGQGAALQTGIDRALQDNPDILVTFDADGQHKASDIHHLIRALIENQVNYALGSRFLGNALNIPLSRKALLKAATLFTRLTCGISVTDTHNGLRAMTRVGARYLKLRQNRMAHASEILEQIAYSGLGYIEVPVSIEYTPYSLEKGQKLSDAAHIVLDLFAGRLHQ